MNNWKLLFLLALPLLFSACKKDNTDGTYYNPKPDTQSEALTDNYIKYWRIISISLNDTIPEEVPECNSDDIYSFHFDGYFELLNGNLKCDDEVDISTGSWQFFNDKTDLQITFNAGYIGYFEVHELTDNYLTLAGNAYDSSGNYIGLRSLRFQAQ
tara:strand:- start:8929 stop:9396 length:468 start_codon:yes stop_codon:yes gene_type:complete